MEERYKNKYRVSSPRYRGWDYAWNGIYFVTINTHKQSCYFGDIVNGRMEISDMGRIAKKIWQEIPMHFPNVRLEDFVIMPNHIHGLIVIEKEIDDGVYGRDAMVCKDNAGGRDAINRVFTDNANKFNLVSIDGGITGDNNPMGKNNLSEIVRWYKGRCSFEIHKLFGSKSFQWQTRFHEHIVKNEKSLEKIRWYIRHNPAKWHDDTYFV